MLRVDVAICPVELVCGPWSSASMDAFQRCVQDLGSIDRLLQLPNGKEIAVEMFRELTPYLEQMAALKEQDPTGALACLLDYAESARARLNFEKFASGMQPNMRPSPRVA